MKAFDPDDPQLTAHALGDLDGAEMREVEALLARDAAARRHVEAIRAAAAGFGAAFEREPAPAVSPIRAVEIERPRRRAPWIPWLFYASTGAVACFFVVLIVRLTDLPPASETAGGRAAEAPLPAAENKSGAAAAAELREPRIHRQEKSDATDTFADAPAAAAAESEGRALKSIRQRDDTNARALATLPATAPAPAQETANGVEAFRGANAGSLLRTPLSAGEKDAAKSGGTLAALRAAFESGAPPARIDAPALLAELGVQMRNDFSSRAKAGQVEEVAPPDADGAGPEAALFRAVEGFARLIAEQTPAADGAWDQVLADARAAAGSDARRLELVETIEAARSAAGRDG